MAEANFSCSLCLDLLDLPITTPCQHSFCKECLLEHVRTSRRCPLCRASLPMPQFRRSSIREQTPNPVISAAMQRFMEDCSNTGCSYRNIPRKLERHSLECLFRIVVCTNDTCGEIMTAGELDNHLEMCEYTKCSAYPYGCDVIGSSEYLSIHTLTCRYSALATTVENAISETVKREVEEALKPIRDELEEIKSSNPARVALSAASGIVDSINRGQTNASLRIPGTMFLNMLNRQTSESTE